MGDAREEETRGGRGGGKQNEMRAENKRGEKDKALPNGWNNARGTGR